MNINESNVFDKATLNERRFVAKADESFEYVTGEYGILQKKQGHRFGTESVLLANFASVFCAKGQVADFGTGTGIMPLLLAAHGSKAHFDALEIDPEMVDMASRTIVINGLTEQIHVRQGDIAEASKILSANSYDAILCNPPFYAQSEGAVSKDMLRANARAAQDDMPMAVSKAARALLKNKGRIFLVYPAEKMLLLTNALEACNLQPKEIRLVCDRKDKPPRWILLSAIKAGNKGLKWSAPLLLHEDDGTESKEYKAIYHEISQ